MIVLFRSPPMVWNVTFLPQSSEREREKVIFLALFFSSQLMMILCISNAGCCCNIHRKILLQENFYYSPHKLAPTPRPRFYSPSQHCNYLSKNVKNIRQYFLLFMVVNFAKSNFFTTLLRFKFNHLLLSCSIIICNPWN